MAKEKETRSVGQPMKFDTPEELQNVIDNYFMNTPEDELSVTGLGLAVGSKQTLADYEKRKEYAHIVKNAKLHIENSYEINMRSNGGAHNIFALKNFGWKDKTEVIKTNVNYTSDDLKNMTDDELDRIARGGK